MVDFVFIAPLWLLAIVPLAPLLIYFSRGSRSTSLIASHIATGLQLARHKNHRSLYYFVGLFWFLSILALAAPSLQKQTLPVYNSSNARVLMLDMSRSLYAQDIKPNRLTQVKYKALDLLPAWQEGTTGLVAYAGDAYTISPLTSDAATLANQITNLSPSIMPYPGANAGAAVKLAISMLTQAGFHQGDLVLISDDIDNNERKTIEALLADTQWRLSILAVASEAGAPIPLQDGTLLTNSTDTTIIAKPNIDNMIALSQRSAGVFALSQNDKR